MRAFLNAIKIICYICSFPLFIAIACVASMTNIKMGGDYGFLTYVSIVVPIAFGVIWAAVVAFQEFRVRKDTINKTKKIRRQTARQVVLGVFLCAGVMMVLDILLPPVLPDLTSGTIYYEDLVEEDAANNRAKLNKDLLNAIVARSIMNGIIGEVDKEHHTQYYTYYKTEDIYGKSSYNGYEVNVDADGTKTPVVMTKYGYYVTVESFTANNNPAPDKTNVTQKAFDDAVADGTESGWVRMNPTARTDEEIKTMDEYFAGKIKKYCDEGFKNKEVQALLKRDGKNNLFGSLNLSGYESWIGPWIDFANEGKVKRMTVPVIVNLIIGQRQTIVSKGKPGSKSYANPTSNPDTSRKLQTALQPYPKYNPATGKVEHLQIGWTVLDMMGDGFGVGVDPALRKQLDGELGKAPKAPMELALGLGDEGLFNMLFDMIGGLDAGGLPIGRLLEDLRLLKKDKDGSLLGLTIPSVYYLIDSLLCTVSYAIGSPELAGTPVFKDGDDVTNSGWQYGFAPLTLRLVNKDGTYGVRAKTKDNDVYLTYVGDKAANLGLYSNNYSRGTIGYMQYAWADANGLLFAITGLFAIRRTCYIFSAVIAILAIIIGEVRLRLCKMDKKVIEIENKIKEPMFAEDGTPIEESSGVEPVRAPGGDDFDVVSYDEAYGGEGAGPGSYIPY